MLAHHGGTEKFCECGCGTSVTKRFALGHNGGRRRPVEKRFWEKVNKEGPIPSAEVISVWPDIADTPCWEWIGSISFKGYGQFNDRGNNVAAHRTSWFLAYGEYPSEQCLHKCDNRACVRPLHLFEGTNMDNVLDCIAKNRNTHPVGEMQGNSKLKTEQVLAIRKLYSEGASAKSLSMKFGTVTGNIYNIVLGINWKHLLPMEETQ